MRNYDFSLENIKSIINSNAVPNNSDGIDLEIGKNEVTIKKPYIDDDGDSMGNSIYIDNNKGMVVRISIENAGDQEIMLTLFTVNKTDRFEQLNQNSPQHVKDYANEMWVKTIDALAVAESEWEADFSKSQQAFEAQFNGRAVPEIIQKLFVLEKMHGTENFSECFFLDTYDKTGISTWSEHPDFLNAFIEFARANGSGSSYAFWATENDLENCPIVVFGDEGGIHIAAENVNQLLHLLTFDTEISVSHESAYFYRDENDDDYEESDGRPVYLNFIKVQLGKEAITSMEECDAIMDIAQKKYQDKLIKFISQHLATNVN